jgi:hypothetical protein
MTNEERSGRAMDALRDYRMEDDDFGANVTDLMTDMLHAIRILRENSKADTVRRFKSIAKMAVMHFEAEVGG